MSKTDEPGAFLDRWPRSNLPAISAHAFREVRPRDSMTREERKTVDEMHRQELTLRAEKALIFLAGISVADIARLIEQIGLNLMQDSQRTLTEAEDTLNAEFLRKFRAFQDRSLAQGAHDILEIQALAKENIMDIVVDSPNFRQLPPEKRSLISRLFGRGTD
jgi:hypothetical protein